MTMIVFVYMSGLSYTEASPKLFELSRRIIVKLKVVQFKIIKIKLSLK